MYLGHLVKIDTALYRISTQRNLAVASENISMLLNHVNYGRYGNGVPATLGPNPAWRHKTTTQSIIRGTAHFCLCQRLLGDNKFRYSLWLLGSLRITIGHNLVKIWS
jgi:hypothetical protein